MKLLLQPVTKRSFTAFVISILLSTTQSFSQAGTLDSSFGVNGLVAVTIDSFDFASAAVTAVQQDKKIVIGGFKYFDFGAYSARGFVLSRLLPNGNLDVSFGAGGVVTTILTTFDCRVGAIAIQQDGKILLGGTVYFSGVGEDFLLARYQSNGRLDSTFGVNGIVITSIGSYDRMYGLAIQNDGKILAVGYSDVLGVIVRYNVNGKVDSTFATNGVSLDNSVPSRLYSISSIKVLSNQEILVAGLDSSYTNFTIMRLQSNGSVDATFGIKGETIVRFFNVISSEPKAMAIDKSNEIIVVGTGYRDPEGNQQITAMTKIKSNGIIDSSFGVNGIITESLHQSSIFANSVWIQNDQKIIITAPSGGGYGNYVVARFQSNGIIDSTFGTNGNTAINIHPWDSYQNFNCSALQPDGKIIVVGNGGFNAVRVNGDPTTVSIQKNLTTLEGNSGTTPVAFKIILGAASTKTIAVNFTTVDGTAKAGQDYVATSGTITFKPGATSKPVTVNVIGDNIIEKNEKFSLQLNNPTNAILGTLATATCTIKNDDVSGGTVTNAIATANSIKLYPNPVTDILRIEGLNKNAMTTISLINTRGQLVSKNSTSNGAYSLDVKQLSIGNYFVKIESEHNSTTLKFVKE